MLFSRPLRHAAQGAAALAVAAGSFGVAHYDKAVEVSVDGKPSSVHVLGSTVADVLDKQDITVGPHDVVVPSLASAVNDGDHISVRYGRKLTVTVDGQTREYWTTATTVDTALKDLGIRADGAVLSASRSQSLGRSGLTLPVTISVTYRKSDTLDKAFSGMKVAWDAAGFNTQLVGIPAKTYYTTLQAPESASKYDVYWAGWGADYPSASTDIPPLFDSRINISAGGPGQDYGYFDNADFNAKIDATNKIADMTAREKAWGDLDKELTTKYYACIPLIDDKFVFVHGSNVQGVFVNGTYTGYYDPATVSLKSV